MTATEMNEALAKLLGLPKTESGEGSSGRIETWALQPPNFCGDLATALGLRHALRERGFEISVALTPVASGAVIYGYGKSYIKSCPPDATDAQIANAIATCALAALGGGQ